MEEKYSKVLVNQLGEITDIAKDIDEEQFNECVDSACYYIEVIKKKGIRNGYLQMMQLKDFDITKCNDIEILGYADFIASLIRMDALKWISIVSTDNRLQSFSNNNFDKIFAIANTLMETTKENLRASAHLSGSLDPCEKLNSMGSSISRSIAVLEEIFKLESKVNDIESIKSSYDDFIIKDFNQYSDELSVCLSVMEKLTE